MVPVRHGIHPICEAVILNDAAFQRYVLELPQAGYFAMPSPCEPGPGPPVDDPATCCAQSAKP